MKDLEQGMEYLEIASRSMKTEMLKYDGLNRQVSRTLNSNPPISIYSVWDGWNLIEEVQSGSVTAAYLYRATGMIRNHWPMISDWLLLRQL